MRALGRIQATVEEAASVLRCSKRTLQYFFEENPEAKTTFEDGRHEGCASLRRKQFAMAETNATMAIWLGKQYLGQSDKSHVTGDHTVTNTTESVSETAGWVAGVLGTESAGTPKKPLPN